jgi:hypothetical protein
LLEVAAIGGDEEDGVGGDGLLADAHVLRGGGAVAAPVVGAGALAVTGAAGAVAAAPDGAAGAGGVLDVQEARTTISPMSGGRWFAARMCLSPQRKRG